MADNGKITFELELDDSKVKGQVDKTIQQLKQISGNQDVKISVSADVGSANSQLSTLKGKTADLAASKPIINVSASTSDADSQLDTTKGKADDLGAADEVVTVTADVQSATDGLNDVKNTADEATKSVGFLGEALTHAAGSWIAAAGSGLFNGAKSAVGSIFTSGAAYEKGLAKVQTLAGAEADMDELSDDLLNLSSLYGQDATIMTEAAYNLLSAGASVENLPDLLDLSGMLAMGGFTDINTAGQAMIKTANAYGMTANSENLKRIGELMMLTQNFGITDVGKLSATLAQVTPIAGANKMGFDQVSAGAAVLTKAGVETSTAMVQMKGLISELAKDDSQANKAMKAALKGTAYKGMSFAQAMESGANIYEILDAMDKYAKKNKKSITDLFSSSEAGSAALLFTAMDESGNSIFMQILNAMREDLAGSVQEDGTFGDHVGDTMSGAYATMRDTTATSLDKLNSQMQSTAIRIFEALAPSIERLLEVLDDEGVVAIMEKMIDGINTFVSGDGFSSFIEGLAQFGYFILDVLNGDVSFGDIMNSMGTAFATGISAVLEALWNTIQNGFVSLANMLIDRINDAFGWMGVNIEHLEPVNTGNSEALASNTDAAADSMATAAENADGLAGESDKAKIGFTGVAEKANATKTAVAQLPTAFASLAAQIRAIKVVNAATTGGGGSTSQTMNYHAVGLDYVPFDNYPAMLHKGEMVLNAAEASAFRLYNDGGSGGAEIDYNALASAMGKVQISMDGRTVGRLVEPHVSHSQAVRYDRL